MSHEPFEVMLSGGNPNSLGRTVEVVDIILQDQSKLQELYACYFSDDETVRLRTSNAAKRIWREKPDWIVPYIDRFIDTISTINQDSARWTTSDLFRELDTYLTDEQRANATSILKMYLQNQSDWIVLNSVMQTLAQWAKQDQILKQWLRPYLEQLSNDERKSVSKRATKLLDTL